MVTPSGRSTSMVMAAITVPDDQESSDPVPTVDQHLSRTVAHRGHSGKPQKPWCSHLTPEEPERPQEGRPVRAMIARARVGQAPRPAPDPDRRGKGLD